jgi:hypothetical protein
MTVKLLSLASLVLAPFAFAQAPVHVFNAELSAPFGAIPGKVVVHETMLTFVDQEKPESSFALEKGNIQSLTRLNDSLVVQLRKAVRDRVGESTRLSFRLPVASESAVLEQWLEKGMAAATAAPKAGEAPADSTTYRFKFPARRDKMIGGTNGTLMVTESRLIFESLDKAEDSRRWEFKDIKELKRKNPFEVEIVPFQGEKYSLKLSGKGMETNEFNEIIESVTKARTAR